MGNGQGHPSFGMTPTQTIHLTQPTWFLFDSAVVV